MTDKPEKRHMQRAAAYYRACAMATFCCAVHKYTDDRVNRTTLDGLSEAQIKDSFGRNRAVFGEFRPFFGAGGKNDSTIARTCSARVGAHPTTPATPKPYVRIATRGRRDAKL
jgi:hypothetical protein